MDIPLFFNLQPKPSTQTKPIFQPHGWIRHYSSIFIFVTTYSLFVKCFFA